MTLENRPHIDRNCSRNCTVSDRNCSPAETAKLFFTNNINQFQPKAVSVNKFSQTAPETAFYPMKTVTWSSLADSVFSTPLRGVCVRAKKGARTPRPRGVRERVHDPP